MIFANLPGEVFHQILWLLIGILLLSIGFAIPICKAALRERRKQDRL